MNLHFYYILLMWTGTYVIHIFQRIIRFMIVDAINKSNFFITTPLDKIDIALRKTLFNQGKSNC